MSVLADIRVLYHLAVRPVRGSSHRERMESFYAGQARGYDGFRRRLLAGRAELYGAMPPVEGGVWIDLGGGTGANLEHIPTATWRAFARIEVVDLAPSLLRIADERIADAGWHNARTVAADATEYGETASADVVTFSYSLTMIPNWFAAIDNALRVLKAGGTVGVVDFFVARKHPPPGRPRHGWFTRSFWPLWFAADNVFLSPDQLEYLHARFEPLECRTGRNRIPYLPLRVPYYIFRGTKRAEA